ncbi:6763_t:CDS:10 [Entrophospora sp. SA101]|nr:6763_t:CDS:10 [Entrophospora sp. SA101]
MHLAANESLFWGTYRPNLYFGVRPRLPESLLSGLMWFGLGDYYSLKNFRHQCDQADKMKEYSYKKHDGRNFGVQTITDEVSNIILKSEFVKVSNGGGKGGDWAVRISGKPIDYDKPSKTSIFYYFALEGEGYIDLINPIDKMGETPDLGNFNIKIVDDSNNQSPTINPIYNDEIADISKTQFFGQLISDDDLWKAKEKYSNEEFPPPHYSFLLNNLIEEDSNFYAFQKIFEGSFQFDIIYQSDLSSTNIDSGNLGVLVEKNSKEFDQRFENTFKLTEKGFNSNQIKFAQSITSNLLGGIGYFYGSSMVDRTYSGDEDDMEEVENFWEKLKKSNPTLTLPTSLFTATPSRSFFPRGFYCLDITMNWVNLIDNDGWIAREQILGEEARSKVPPEFQIQYPYYANPPTLYMSIISFIDRLENFENQTYLNVQEILLQQQDIILDNLSATTNPELLRIQHLINPELGDKYLKQIYEKLKLNYEWFRRTQRGEIKEWGRKASNNREAYRWRGRTPGHTLTSGLDDYPRPSPPHPSELHVDLMCWVGLMSRTLSIISKRLNEEDDFEDFTNDFKKISQNLHDLHWSENDKVFCDLSIDEDVEESIFVCHKGYLSLFPLFLEFIPNDSPKLESLLDLIYDPNELWSPSLSKSDEFFGTNENYWRGPVWININYLILSSLYKNYAKNPGPYQTKAQTIYKELRNNIINNVFKEFERTGYVWEQYSSIDGKGSRSHPFTGWTALVTLIMAEKY